MDYSKLVAVTGLPGLYELINSKNDGAIIRSLDDDSTKFASSRIHNFSHLESIEVFTSGENVNLVEIFHAMEKSGDTPPDTKENGLVKKYFEKTYPELDFEKVYPSDLKKMIKWFEVLKKNNVEIKLTEPEEEVEEEPVEEIVEEKPEKKPAKKTTKSASPDTAKKSSVKEKEEKPAKKAAKKSEEAPKKKSAPKKK